MTNIPGPKRVLITGGVHRLGLEIAKTFASEGWVVGLNYRSSPDSIANAAGTACLDAGAKEVIILKGSIVKEPEAIVERFVSEAGGIDVLINNAGVMQARAKLDELEIDRFRETLETNLIAPLALSKFASRSMKSGSSIINIASLGGYQVWEGRMDYNVSKAALMRLTRSLARELAPKGIRVNAVAPGALQLEHETEEDMGLKIDRIPLHRFGTGKDIADAILFFVNTATYVTGETLLIDGGRSLLT